MKQEIKTVPVSLSERSYPILIGRGLLKHPEHWLPRSINGRKVFIITDEHVADPHAACIQAAIRKHGAEVLTYVLPPGERTKSFSFYETTLEWLIENGASRACTIIAIGGGVVGDLSGFVAASLLRGVEFFQIPTTLLSQVDSSVGGKTGINSRQGKNLIGAFYQPRIVIVDLETLMTLPEREMRAGYAEILKYGLLGNLRFFEWLEDNGAKVLMRDFAALSHAIETSCRMKSEIVRQDEREETGLRALLNLGHTFAHALETACGYDGRLLHGEAVAIGLVLAARLSQRLGYISEEDSVRVKRHLEKLGINTEIANIEPPLTVTGEQLLALMQKDKKVTATGLNFVVLQKLGRAQLDQSASPQLILEILRESLTHD